MRIYCGPVAPYGPTVYKCFFGELLRIYCGPVAPHGPTVYMCFFAEPQNPTGPQCISRIDLRARRRSAVDPQTNTCETVVPQDLTGQQWIRKIQRACSKSAKSIGRARSRSSLDPRTNTCKTVDRQIQLARSRSAKSNGFAVDPPYAQGVLCTCRFQYVVQMLRHPAVTQQYQKLQQQFAGLIQPTREQLW